MTFPSGAPGGFPGQGPQQPQQPYSGATPSTGGGMKLGLPQILFLVTAGLGVLNLFLGFANLGGDQGVYAVGFGWIVLPLLISGLAALVGILPGDQKPGAWPAIFAVGGVLTFLFTVFQFPGDLQAGGVMILIFGILQMLAAIAGYLLENNIIKPPSPQAASPYGQPGAYGQQAGYAPQQQYGQQQPGQQQPVDQTGSAPQQTKFVQPVSSQQPGQQTQYAPQQGQFFQQQQQQQQQQEGGQQNQPGTPPGGFGQSNG
ncbi:hypothetical protein BAY61_03245 [Prauserella marina]|uniref:Uncharacterized protein n=1 Tax=Prauserella marina TaxID=530584 RepID=A0A222VK24_9PSEU|nr:DUF5336 domain-containing protein [Prauserella marina]ASR34172.1 hypothetical protein BAY61_03245 [Prauserella marina]PWV70517.1 hypothetical protein DES30_11622 [Prauserella marina]SDE03528.1 hypothetical protein SAMN05421630_1194 [Prauserella marina]